MVLVDRHWIVRMAGILVAAVVILVLAGCGTSQRLNRHDQAVSNATRNWLSIRSAAIGKSAQQAFDAGDLKQAERTLHEALALDPGNPMLHLLAGRIFLERSQLERSYHRFQATIELTHQRKAEAETETKSRRKVKGDALSDVVTPDPTLAQAHYYVGIVLQRWQRYDKAFEEFELAFQYEADNVVYLLSMAEMYINLDQFQAALVLLESKQRYFDQNAGIRVAIGQVYSILKQYDKAVAALRQATLLRPDDHMIIEELAVAQIDARKYEQAAGNIQRILREQESRRGQAANVSINTDSQLLLLNSQDISRLKRALADCYMQQDRLDDARIIYIALSRADRKDAGTWARLGEIAWAQGNETEAFLAAQRVMALAPQRHEGYLLAGMVWQSRNDLPQAIRMFDRAAQTAQDQTLPLILKGLALEQAGKTADAARAYTTALDRDPNDRRVRKLLANVSGS